MVVTFTDGPADGVALNFARAPEYLRVVSEAKSAAGFDVLDQLTDDPNAWERVHVYHRSAYGFACRGGPGEYATYVYVDGVEGENLRDRAAWRAWVEDKVGKPINPETGADA